jgi:hypothetical protein
MHLDAKIFFSLIIKKHYYQPKSVKPSLLEISKPLNANILDFHMSIFKYSVMKMQAPNAMVEPFNVNRINNDQIVDIL